MTQKPAPPLKKQTLKGALFDLLVLVLMLCAAGFGGYFYGTHQKMAIVDLVPPGTTGAREMVNNSASNSNSTANTDKPSGSSKSTAQADDKPAHRDNAKKPGKLKYWLASSGDRFVGYQIAVTVNDTPVDNFFAPGKQVDITDLVKKGENNVVFQANQLEEKFNQHKGEAKYALTVQLVSGPALTENFKPGDVILTYRRTAADNQNFNDPMQFVAE